MSDRQRGTRRLYSIDPAGLKALRAYLEEYWSVALAAFEQAGESEPAEEGGER